MSDAREAGDRLAWIIGSAIGVGLAALLLIGASALPAVCPAVAPPPASCLPGARVPYAVAAIIALVVGWVALALAARFVPGARLGAAMTWLVILLVVILAVGLGATLFASGFVIP